LSPTWAEVITAAIDARIANVHTAMPGRVVEYDASTQTASVQPLVMASYVDERGDRIPERLPVIHDVPICFPSTGSYAITWPISAGDVVLIVVASCSLDQWLARGGELDPEDDRRHHLADAVAIPGLRSRNAALSTPASDGLTVRGDLVRLGSDSAAQSSIRGTAYRSAEDTMLTAIQSLATALATVHGGAGAYPDPATASAATAAATAITTFLSSAGSYVQTGVRIP
jgi:hypothetical protein